MNAVVQEELVYARGEVLEGTRSVRPADRQLPAAKRSDQVIDKCLQIFSGYDYMAEYPIANMYTGSRGNRTYGGTSEIMKEIISRSM